MKALRKPLKKVSDKRAAEWKVYLPLKRKFLKEHAFCERCIKIAETFPDHGLHPSTQVHHWAGRRSNFLKVETWKPSCDECNIWAKNHPREAREEGWIAPVGVYLT